MFLKYVNCEIRNGDDLGKVMYSAVDHFLHIMAVVAVHKILLNS